MEHICTCNNCGKLFIDTNPQVDAKKFDVDYLDLEELIDHECPTCETDDALDDTVYKVLWNILGDIPCDNEDGDEISEKFLHFEIGTETDDIWHWFEDTFDISVAVDLMGLE